MDEDSLFRKVRLCQSVLRKEYLLPYNIANLIKILFHLKNNDKARSLVGLVDYHFLLLDIISTFNGCTTLVLYEVSYYMEKSTYIASWVVLITTQHIGNKSRHFFHTKERALF